MLSWADRGISVAGGGLIVLESGLNGGLAFAPLKLSFGCVSPDGSSCVGSGCDLSGLTGNHLYA